MKQILALLPVFLFGCFTASTTPEDRCLERQVCAPVDSLGCCDGVGSEISVCESCPAGTVTESSCRTTGCTTGCETPIACRVDVGAGCCGDAVFTTSCDTCPAGSVPADSCTDSFPSCGCDDARRIRAPEEDPAPPPACRADLGNGCCGEIVGSEGMCGCAPGSIRESDCGQIDGDAEAPGIIAPSCFADLGGGCCGDSVDSVACGMCPEGSVPASECAPMAGAPEDPARPIMPPEFQCREDLGGGCCGGDVAANICGMCPAGSISADSCSGDADFFPAPPTSCRVNVGGGCCGAAVEANGCGMCPEGTINEGECVDIQQPLSTDPEPEPGAAPPGDEARPAPPLGCFVVDDTGCCGEAVMTNTCGECPTGSSMDCSFC